VRYKYFIGNWVNVLVQVKFFEIIQFIVSNLNFVPCKELISISILIKTNQWVLPYEEVLLLLNV